MKLYLLRHAETYNDDGGGDKNRRLTGQGMRDAIHLGNVMRDRQHLPDYTLCSSATRTRQTLESLEKGTNPLSSIYLDKLYNAPASTILSVIQQQSGAQSLLVVGHNPGIPELVGLLTGENVMMYPPCTLSIIECACESWAALTPGDNKLVDTIKTH